MLAFVSLFIYSCDDNDDVVQVEDQDTIAQIRDVTGTFNASNSFTITQGIDIFNTDVVLVYRNVGGSSAVWQLIPKTYYLDDNVNFPANRELDYNFDFTTQDVEIRTEANFNQATQMTASETSQFLVNQTFRIVLIPANASKNANASQPVNFEDYNAVIKYYNLDESKIIKTKVN